jgi:hypothetical protein
MQLSAAQQERYARHLILDELGGEGQERLLAASVRVRGTGTAALWAARYLAASGVGQLAVDVPAWEPELQSLGPWLKMNIPSVNDDQIETEPREGSGSSESAMNGAEAALTVVRAIARGARA